MLLTSYTCVPACVEWLSVYMLYVYIHVGLCSMHVFCEFVCVCRHTQMAQSVGVRAIVPMFTFFLYTVYIQAETSIHLSIRSCVFQNRYGQNGIQSWNERHTCM